MERTEKFLADSVTDLLFFGANSAFAVFEVIAAFKRGLGAGGGGVSRRFTMAMGLILSRVLLRQNSNPNPV